MTKKIIRVFPVKTNASPENKYSYFGPPDMFLPNSIDEVHISNTIPDPALLVLENMVFLLFWILQFKCNLESFLINNEIHL